MAGQPWASVPPSRLASELVPKRSSVWRGQHFVRAPRVEAEVAEEAEVVEVVEEEVVSHGL